MKLTLRILGRATRIDASTLLLFIAISPAVPELSNPFAGSSTDDSIFMGNTRLNGTAERAAWIATVSSDPA